jgi:hypothetical protein
MIIEGLAGGLFLGGLVVAFFLLYASVYRSSIERIGSIASDKLTRLKAHPCGEQDLKYTEVVLKETDGDLVGANIKFECRDPETQQASQTFSKYFAFKTPADCLYTSAACLPY